MNVNNVELTSIKHKLEFSNKQQSIDSTTQKLFGQDIVQFDTTDNKSKLFQIGETSQEDIMEAAKSEPSEFVKGALVALGNTATSKDLTELDKEGYSALSDDVDTIVTVTEKIQIYLATHCEDYQITGEISQEVIEKVAGNAQMATEIANQLSRQNLPVTKDNVDDTKEALDIANQLQPISEGAVKYIINNQLEPTIENIYKAEYSAQSSAGGTYAAGFFSEGAGYYGKTSDEFNWDSLKDSIEKVIQSANLEVNEETRSDAKWLMENHIPLTKEALSQYEALKDVTLPMSEQDVLAHIMQAIQEGKRPAQALLTNGPSLVERAENAYQVVMDATDEHVKSVIEKEQPVTIANIKNAMVSEEIAKEVNDTTQEALPAIPVEEDSISYVTARRQLEQIRLQMTTEANYRLLKQGISIETTDLQTLIQQLQDAEDTYYKQLLNSGEVEVNPENINTLKDITTKLADIYYVPSDVVGKVVSGETANTLQAIHSSGTILKSTYESANQSYEALMTKPRSDMGDRITKAFQNVDDILIDLGLTTTQSNQRAVRILGYNSMEITKENIQAVKQADAAVTQAITNLTPKVVLNMIREGLNPLDTDINQLNQQLKSQNEALGTDNTNEKYSEYLWRLEKNNEITEREREAYIGMYRLLNQVEKTDGQVIGALLNQNADITLNNLLTSVRSSKSKGMDVTLDNSFGELESLTTSSTSISDQLQASFGGKEGESNQQSDQSEKDAALYYNHLVSKALKGITPDKLDQVLKNHDFSQLSLEQLVDELSNANENESITKQYYQEQLATIQKASQVEANVINMLSDYKQPVTVENLFAAQALMYQRGSLFKKLSKQEEGKTELKDAMEQITSALTSKEEMVNAYENLEQSAVKSLDAKAEQSTISSLDLKELKLLMNEIKMATNLSRQESYEIPIQIGDEITSIHLTVLKGSKAGKVAVTMDNELLGKASAEFQIKEGSVSGYIATDNQEGLEQMKEKQDAFTNQLEKSNLSVRKIDYITSSKLDINAVKKDTQSLEQAEETSSKALYQIAKAFVVAMKTA